MSYHNFIRGCVCLAVVFSFSLAPTTTTRADDKVDAVAAGTGIYSPATGYFFGEGDGTPLGKAYYNGKLEIDPTGPLTFNFQNAGRGTDDEVLQETYAEDGSALYFRCSGTVTLNPLNNLGDFTATWKGVWEVVRGTGRMRNAKGNLNVTAVNEPFNIADPQWAFNWSWEGDLKIKKNATRHYTKLQTGGHGVFDPANLGLGDPNQFPFPIVIGDGSGLGVYDGTPTGNEFKLDDELVGDGWDQHFGTAQSFGPGIPAFGNVYYPGAGGPNPDGSGRNIHIMDTNVGEIWYRNRYYFQLDPIAGAIYARCNFEVIGGTGMFHRATGTVYCQVEAPLADVFVDPQGDVNAPFRYDFQGYIDLR